jgi:hypothetical protein
LIGTVSVDAPTFVAAVTQVGAALVSHGFRRLVLLNGHAGNAGALQLSEESRVFAATAAERWIEAKCADNVEAQKNVTCVSACYPSIVDRGRRRIDDLVEQLRKRTRTKRPESRQEFVHHRTE